MARDITLNDVHALMPQEGDYWHEMYCPIARVLMVSDQHVLVQKLAGCAGKEVSSTDPKPTIMTRRRFNSWLRYDSMPDKTWCDVIPYKFSKGARP